MAKTAVGDAAETIEKNFASFMECVNKPSVRMTSSTTWTRSPPRPVI